MELTEQEIVRRKKVEEISKYCNPYPEKYEVSHTLKEASFLEDETKDVSVAGRIMAKRIMGKASFCTIQDGTGRIQSYVSINDLGEESYKQFKEDAESASGSLQE
mgnify:CR=1 FL=1